MAPRGIAKQILGTIVAVLSGWFAAMLFLEAIAVIQLLQQPHYIVADALWVAPITVSMVMAYFVIPVWLFLLIPLFVFVPASSALWRCPGLLHSRPRGRTRHRRQSADDTEAKSKERNKQKEPHRGELSHHHTHGDRRDPEDIRHNVMELLQKLNQPLSLREKALPRSQRDNTSNDRAEDLLVHTTRSHLTRRS